MDNKRWVYPYDSKGERRQFKDIPKSVVDLKDDPFRSLAGELRRAGGFAKDTTPFSEFLWADFLRRRLSRKVVEDDFEKAIEKGLTLVKGHAAGRQQPHPRQRTAHGDHTSKRCHSDKLDYSD